MDTALDLGPTLVLLLAAFWPPIVVLFKMARHHGWEIRNSLALAALGLMSWPGLFVGYLVFRRVSGQTGS